MVHNSFTGLNLIGPIGIPSATGATDPFPCCPKATASMKVAV